MSRSLSSIARRAVNASETGEAFLLLLTISHDELPEPIRVVNNTEDIVSRGETYQGCPFEFELPGDDAERVESVQIAVDNVDRRIVDALRQISGAPKVDLEVILASEPDVVEAGPFSMTFVSAEWDAIVVSAQLGYEDVLTEPFPGHAYVPADYPGLF